MNRHSRIDIYGLQPDEKIEALLFFTATARYINYHSAAHSLRHAHTGLTTFIGGAQQFAIFHSGTWPPQRLGRLGRCVHLFHLCASNGFDIY